MREVPTIDFAPLLVRPGSGSSSAEELREAARVASTIRDAASSLGFFYITNHGIDRETIREVLECTRAFYTVLPPSSRMAVRAGAGEGTAGPYAIIVPLFFSASLHL